MIVIGLYYLDENYSISFLYTLLDRLLTPCEMLTMQIVIDFCEGSKLGLYHVRIKQFT